MASMSMNTAGVSMKTAGDAMADATTELKEATGAEARADTPLEAKRGGRKAKAKKGVKADSVDEKVEEVRGRVLCLFWW